MLVTQPQLIDDFYKALCERQPSYVGSFYVAVKTTSIFCIATCHARKPKKENVDFYTSIDDVVKAGFRPCKVCKPLEKANEMPLMVKRAVELVKTDLTQKVKDTDLKANGITPETVRRWFNKHYGMTFQSYARMMRMNNAMKELDNGKKAIDTAFDSGYESLSGFNEAFKKMTGHSPNNEDGKTIILIDRLTTPIGPMFVCATAQGVCLIEFVDRKNLKQEFEELQQRLDGVMMAGENEHIKQAKAELAEYFAGSRQQFDLTLYTPSTAFRESVWQGLRELEYGTTTSYLQQAVKLGNEKAIRAVASANGQNRIAIVIPCHRVIGKDGSLTGYAGGLARKKWLLEHEAKFLSQ
ncbi:methylated-DNA--[protein]-cysteine S-methyltransferase [Psychrobium sp. MM17-31]|uniref:bifunctional transcriptional activator/DNA repair enzyme AdaA n=1 Tax=Psychrobium sp. MM17-31 TaxID=2917758 RepID=UPI001EF4F048|nr:methylated-DNA--[protein]-cysteine S-methyltransferase [Psychrobium sp. MM17-31]MCG7530146.1 methylated-DNA--[protein]-cysteine S-methyltransferase [Psychrobium sp. MM17-31]